MLLPILALSVVIPDMELESTAVVADETIPPRLDRRPDAVSVLEESGPVPLAGKILVPEVPEPTEIVATVDTEAVLETPALLEAYGLTANVASLA